MIKYTSQYLSRLNDKVNCDCCGKEMRRGQRVCNIPGNVCVPCAKNGYRGKQKKR